MEEKLKELLLKLRNSFRVARSDTAIKTPKRGDQNLSEHTEETFVAEDGKVTTAERKRILYLECFHFAEPFSICEYRILWKICHKVMCQACSAQCVCGINICPQHATVIEEVAYCKRCATSVLLRKEVEDEEKRWQNFFSE